MYTPSARTLKNTSAFFGEMIRWNATSGSLEVEQTTRVRGHQTNTFFWRSKLNKTSGKHEFMLAQARNLPAAQHLVLAAQGECPWPENPEGMLIQVDVTPHATELDFHRRAPVLCEMHEETVYGNFDDKWVKVYFYELFQLDIIHTKLCAATLEKRMNETMKVNHEGAQTLWHICGTCCGDRGTNDFDLGIALDASNAQKAMKLTQSQAKANDTDSNDQKIQMVAIDLCQVGRYQDSRIRSVKWLGGFTREHSLAILRTLNEQYELGLTEDQIMPHAAGSVSA